MTIETRGAIAHLQWHRWEDLESSYDSEYPTAPYLNYVDNELSQFSFTVNHWLYFYVEMHRMSGATRWLELGRDTCQHMIDNNDVARVGRGDFVLNGSTVGVDRYWQAPYPYTTDATPVPGWSSNDGAPSLRVQILQDGQIIGAMAYFTDYILSENLTSYIANANAFFTHIKLVLDSHENSWRSDLVSINPPVTVQGNWYYPEKVNGDNSVSSNILAFNHSAGACQAALLYHKHLTDTALLDKATRFMAFTRSNRVDAGAMFEWEYSVEGSYSSEDLNHGSYSFMFFMIAKINGYISVDDAELTKYANATINAWQGVKIGDLAEKFDGSGDIIDSEAFDPSHYVDMAKYNKTMYRVVAEAHAVRSKDQRNYSRMFRGAATMLRYNQLGSLL